MVKKKLTFKKVYHDYINNKYILSRYQWVGILMLVWMISGFIGWVYEFFVGLIDKGEPYMVGGNLLPWINIYAFGAIAVLPVVYKFKKYPWLAFLMGALVTGAVELLGGWLVYTIGNGTRYWNYDHGAWAWGSINGFVCPLSVIFFGIGVLALIYIIMPFLNYLALKMSRRAFLTLAITLFSLIMVDEIGNLILKNLGQPTAMDLYRLLGAKYQEF